jgi:hypothetical protein
MSFLKKLTGKEGTDQQETATAMTQEEWNESTACPHTALVPRWDSLEDMGKEDKATSYFCQGCEKTFTPEEARPHLG